MFSNFLVSYKKNSRIGNFNSEMGFGLVELMVSITIITIVSGIILTRQSGFNSAVLLRSQAYEIALSAREVQLSAVSASNDSALGNFRSVLGLHFNTDATAGINGTYKIFRDTGTGNNWYNSGEEFGVQGLLDKRFMISEIRVVGSAVAPPNEISIIFQRPNFDARFFDGPNSEVTDPIIQVDVRLRGAIGNDCGRDFRTIEFTGTGQISVNECP